MQKQAKIDELRPLIEKKTLEIAELKDELEQGTEKIKKTTEENDKMEKDLDELNARQEEYAAQIKAK